MRPYFDTRFLIFQTLSCLALLVWLGLSLAALFGLRKKSMGETARVLWALIILAIPLMGAISFWIVNSKSETDQGSVG